MREVATRQQLAEVEAAFGHRPTLSPMSTCHTGARRGEADRHSGRERAGFIPPILAPNRPIGHGRAVSDVGALHAPRGRPADRVRRRPGRLRRRRNSPTRSEPVIGSSWCSPPGPSCTSPSAVGRVRRRRGRARRRRRSPSSHAAATRRSRAFFESLRRPIGRRRDVRADRRGERRRRAAARRPPADRRPGSS